MDNLTQLYGLLRYDESYNLGDEIQSIAAQAYLPSVDYVINRDTGHYTSRSLDEVPQTTIKTIYNGWFDGQYCQFPPPEAIEPLFISFHINEDDHSKDPNYRVLDDKKIVYKPLASYTAYLKKYEPIGCRDLHTLELLKNNGVSTYFSGCLTMTLINPYTERTSDILVIDAHIACGPLFRQLIPVAIRDRAIYLTQAIETQMSHEVKMQKAQALLDRMAQAKLVITSRLHTVLPCLAYRTPVVFLHNNLKDIRFTGLLPFFKAYTDGDQLDIDLETYQNIYPPDFHSLVDSMRSRVHTWLSSKTGSHMYRGLPGYSIFSVCMNRNEHLEKTLPTWLKAQPNEIVIVDWGSKVSLKKIVDQYNVNRKIRLITITNVDQWVLTQSFNLAARMTRYDKLLKLDCDSLLDEYFFAYHNLDATNVFFAGNWKQSRDENETHTNGLLYVRRTDFFRVGGYNELIKTYGYDDCDLYERLEKNSKRLLINLESVKHVAHSNQQRIENQHINQWNRLDVEIEKNRLISELHLWKGPYATYKLTKISDIEYTGEFLYANELNQTVLKQVSGQAMKNRYYVYKTLYRRKKFYIKTNNGLSNRLRALASAYNIARGSDRQLVVIWVPDYHCQATFSDLFKRNYLFKDVEILQTEPNTNGQDCLEYSFQESDNQYQYKKRELVMYDYTVKKDVYIDHSTSTDIYVSSSCVLNNPHTNWSRESFFLRNLEVTDELAEKIYQFGYQHDICNAIGVHIRMGQPPSTHPHEDVSKYTETAKQSVVKWRNNSHWSVFIKELERIKTVSVKQMFFVCCDNEEIYQQLDQHSNIGANIMYYKRLLYDRSVEQIKTAVIDLWLLAKTKFLLGSNWSSFSEIAHRLNGNQLKLAGVDF